MVACSVVPWYWILSNKYIILVFKFGNSYGMDSVSHQREILSVLYWYHYVQIAKKKVSFPSILFPLWPSFPAPLFPLSLIFFAHRCPKSPAMYHHSWSQLSYKLDGVCCCVDLLLILSHTIIILDFSSIERYISLIY